SAAWRSQFSEPEGSRRSRRRSGMPEILKIRSIVREDTLAGRRPMSGRGLRRRRVARPCPSISLRILLRVAQGITRWALIAPGLRLPAGSGSADRRLSRYAPGLEFPIPPRAAGASSLPGDTRRPVQPGGRAKRRDDFGRSLIRTTSASHPDRAG